MKTMYYDLRLYPNIVLDNGCVYNIETIENRSDDTIYSIPRLLIWGNNIAEVIKNLGYKFGYNRSQRVNLPEVDFDLRSDLQYL